MFILMGVITGIWVVLLLILALRVVNTSCSIELSPIAQYQSAVSIGEPLVATESGSCWLEGMPGIYGVFHQSFGAPPSGWPVE